MDQYKRIDIKIKKGYERILKNDYPGGCEKWLDAWEEIKELFAAGIAEDIYDLDDKYVWSEFISNYAQEMEQELHNAGLENKIYHQKRAQYCKELLQWCGTDELIVNNTRRGMAEAYFEYGDYATGEKLFIELIRDAPDWGWGYIGWSDCYQYSFGSEKNEKIEEILLSGYIRSELQEKNVVVERLISLYEDMGNPDKVKEYKKILSELDDTESQRTHSYDTEDTYSFNDKPDPVTVVKIGRNEPCPCGSGKKHKKCCGA